MYKQRKFYGVVAGRVALSNTKLPCTHHHAFGSRCKAATSRLGSKTSYVGIQKNGGGALLPKGLSIQARTNRSLLHRVKGGHWRVSVCCIMKIAKYLCIIELQSTIALNSLMIVCYFAVVWPSQRESFRFADYPIQSISLGVSISPQACVRRIRR